MAASASMAQGLTSKVKLPWVLWLSTDRTCQFTRYTPDDNGAVIGTTMAVPWIWARPVEHDPLHGSAGVNAVDPVPTQVRQSGQVLGLRHHLGLEAAHLTGGGRLSSHCLATHHPAQGRIIRQPVGIVHILVSGAPPADRLAELAQQGMAPAPAGAGVREDISSGLAQTKDIVEFAAGQQTAISRDLRSVELQLETAVERQPKSSVLRFTQRRFHSRHLSSPVSS